MSKIATLPYLRRNGVEQVVVGSSTQFILFYSRSEEQSIVFGTSFDVLFVILLISKENIKFNTRFLPYAR